MIGFLRAIHALAAQRGEGLRPEFVAVRTASAEFVAPRNPAQPRGAAMGRRPRRRLCQYATVRGDDMKTKLVAHLVALAVILSALAACQNAAGIPGHRPGNCAVPGSILPGPSCYGR